MDIEEVTKRSSLARKILDMASLMHCELIPKDVLKQATFTDATDSEDCERQLSSALSLLSGFSLVEHPCNMHNLVQQSVVQAMMRDGSLSDRLRSLSECLTALLPQTLDGIRRNLNNSTVLKLALHVYSVASHILNSEDLQQKCWSMLTIACWLAIESHHMEEAEDLCERRLGYVNNNSDHQEYTTMLLQALMDLGDVRLKMSKPQLAMEPLKKAFDLCTLTYDNRYAEAYAAVLGQLANCYLDLRHFEDAERLFLEELSFKERHQFSQVSVSVGMIYVQRYR
jgi:tetratricopeptide (TPR) repeat protein